MKRVQVLLSSYNGEKYIQKQLDTIFAQKGVEVSCLVRDDGSSDGTLQVLRAYQEQEPRLQWVQGENLGWRKSFMELLRLAGEADYYAFSDQDDEWFEDKLLTGVGMLEQRPEDIPLLFHCARIRKDPGGEQEQQMLPRPLSVKNALMQEYCQGCAMMINRRARDLLCAYRPKGTYGHDFWVGVVCYLLGEVHYSPRPLFYHINHRDNTTATGDVHACQKGRLQSILKGTAPYNNPCRDLLEGYQGYMPADTAAQVRQVRDYRETLWNRLRLFADRGFAKYLVPKKAVLWIHDVGALRNQGDARAIQKEIHLFNQFDTVVAHNPAMIRWLKENGCRSRLLNLQIFDYLTDCPLGAADPAEKRRVHFAGNLSREKSGFLYTSLRGLNSLEICLYGGGYDGQAEGLHYMGSFPPEELPGKLKGGFGLVWDGTSIETCDGNTGNYLRYNDPHKTSLYLAAGIPVILWSQAAMAPFIRDNGLGITVDSLVDLDKAIDGVSDEAYRQMLANCAAAAGRLRSGWYARQIWDQM